MMFVLLLSIVDDVISIGCCIKMSMKIMRTDMLCNDRTSLFDISCPVFEFGRCQLPTLKLSCFLVRESEPSWMDVDGCVGVKDSLSRSEHTYSEH